ncbi:hypothetical protein PO909_002970 [Leuciscus waleckii]
METNSMFPYNISKITEGLTQIPAALHSLQSAMSFLTLSIADNMPSNLVENSIYMSLKGN